MSTKEIYNEIIQLKAILQNLGIQQKEYLNIKEAAQYLSISESCLYKKTANREIEFFQPSGKIILFHIDTIKKFINDGKRKTTNEIMEETKTKYKL